jgi:hypothetical protein
MIILLSTLQKKEFVEVKKRTKEEVDEQDAAFDFVDFRAGADRLGWLVTYSAITVSDPETGAELSGEEPKRIRLRHSVGSRALRESRYFLIFSSLTTYELRMWQASNTILSSRMAINSRRFSSIPFLSFSMIASSGCC